MSGPAVKPGCAPQHSYILTHPQESVNTYFELFVLLCVMTCWFIQITCGSLIIPHPHRSATFFLHFFAFYFLIVSFCTSKATCRFHVPLHLLQSVIPAQSIYAPDSSIIPICISSPLFRNPLSCVHHRPGMIHLLT